MINRLVGEFEGPPTCKLLIWCSFGLIGYWKRGVRLNRFDQDTEWPSSINHELPPLRSAWSLMRKDFRWAVRPRGIALCIWSCLSPPLGDDWAQARARIMVDFGDATYCRTGVAWRWSQWSSSMNDEQILPYVPHKLTRSLFMIPNSSWRSESWDGLIDDQNACSKTCLATSDKSSRNWWGYQRL